MGKLAKVRLKGIFCETEGDDNGANLEIYGWLMANSDTVPNWMWQVGDNDGVNISRNSMYVINKDATIIVRDGEHLHIGGELWDDDDFDADDYMSRKGGSWISIPLHEITPNVKYYEVGFQQSEQKVRVEYEVIQDTL
ncbi:hypothetical protein OB994_25035 [Bacillus cereus]|nr:hypothetical protein [Bacillus cereus]